MQAPLVLLVDDHPQVGSSFAALLSRSGYACVTARNVHEALLRLEESPAVEVAVLDYRIPGFTARELVESVRAARPDVLLVGHSADDRAREFQALGVDRFLRKPWRIEDFLGLVQCR